MMSQEEQHNQAPSLLDQDAQQPDLFSDSDIHQMMIEASTPDAPEYTGERLRRDRPSTYKAVVHLSAEGLGQLRIAKILKVHPSTVAAVQQREGGAIDMVKQRISQLARTGAQLCAEAILEKIYDPEQLKKISARDLAIIHGVLVDKSELLSGGATQRIDHTGSSSAPMTYEDYIAGLPTAEVLPTSKAAGNPPQTGAAEVDRPELGNGSDRDQGEAGAGSADGSADD